MIRFTYDGGTPVTLDNTSLMWRDAVHLEKMTGVKHTEYLKHFLNMDVEAQGVMYWFALYLADRDKSRLLSTFDFDMAKLSIEIEVPDRLNLPGTESAGEGEAAPDPSPAAGLEGSAAALSVDPI